MIVSVCSFFLELNLLNLIFCFLCYFILFFVIIFFTLFFFALLFLCIMTQFLIPSVPLAGASAAIDVEDTREVVITDAMGTQRRFRFADSPTAAEWEHALRQACTRADAALK